MDAVGFLIAAAIILLILILKISVRVGFGDELALTLGVGIFRKRLVPANEKKLRLSDYKIKKFRKIKARQAKIEEKKRKKQQKKKQTQRTDNTAQKVAEARRRAAGEPKQKRDIAGLIGMATEVAKVFISRFGKHLRINIRRLRITVATDNAADTAVMYGAVCGAVQCFMELLNSTAHLKLPREDELCVVPDFTSDKLKADVDVAFSFRVWQIFDMLIRSGIAFLKSYLNKEK